jgi:prepilin-type N-terminal cleavage/methylation domain-containing protein
MRRIPQLTIKILQSSIQPESPCPLGASRLTSSATRLTDKGFTLIEIIVILAVISILVAILTPTVLKFIDDAQRSSAENSVQVLAASINDLIKDTGQFPGSKTSKTFLCSANGDFATDSTSSWAPDDTVCSNFFDHLITNDPDGSGTPDQVTDYRSTGKRRHRGPYLSSIDEDPFGNVYQVNVSTLKGGDRNPTWVISAGPDGDFQTATTDKKLSGDDIGIRIK